MPFVVAWLLNAAYALLLLAVSPLLVYRRIAHGKYRGGWREKLTGRLVRMHPERRCLWFHAVSVGEVLQLQQVLDQTAARFPDAELFITTTTDTGYDVARSKYPQHTVAYFPLDFSWAVRRALCAIQPSLVVLVELELWPNFIVEAHRQHIPLALINGRIGEKSFRGYSRVKPLLRRVLACFDLLAVQNETYAERLRQLGAPTERVTVTGNIKFDGVESNRDNSKTEELRRSFGIAPHEQVFIAGSTQEPEESFAIETWTTLQREFPTLRLILVPRHKERFEAVAELVRQRGLPLVRRSEGHREIVDEISERGGVSPLVLGCQPVCEEPGGLRHPAQKICTSSLTLQVGVDAASPPPSVLLLDTLGELGACWGLADIAFVGGSLTNRGGQNMLEPAGYGAAVLFGPNTWNFRDITDALLSLRAARVVAGPTELTAAVRDLLLDQTEASRMGEAARTFVGQQRGATARTVEQLAGLVADATSDADNSAASSRAA
ncbi:MAG: 3-deoxy-D-manno-octulosonic acid transferase [Planctomycetales bacterium]|nr:3-deoxy-D-manno-octulosonic acid transferase [Planctomycetales bacterium]